MSEKIKFDTPSGSWGEVTGAVVFSGEPESEDTPAEIVLVCGKPRNK